MSLRKISIICIGIFIVLLVISLSHPLAWSKEKYPGKAIDIVLSVAPGSGSDLMSRTVAEGLKKELGVPINIINRSGGGRVPAVESVMKAAPDGYTLLGDIQASSSGQVIVKGWPFKLEERTYIAMMAAVPMGIIIRADRPWKSLNDLKNALKGPEGGGLIWASVGRESAGDFALYEFFDDIGSDHSKIRLVQYKSSNPAATAVAGKNADFAGVNVGTGLPFLSAGKIRFLGVTSESRLKTIPDVPTTKEQGFPGVDSTLWVGLSGPAGLDNEIVGILNNALKKVLQDPAIVKALDKAEAEPAYLGPSEFKAFVFSHAEKVKKLLGK